MQYIHWRNHAYDSHLTLRLPGDGLCSCSRGRWSKLHNSYLIVAFGKVYT